MKKIFLPLFCLILLPVAVFADYKSDLEDGLNALRTGDYPKAYKHLKAAYDQKPSENLGNYLKQATEKYKASMDVLLDEAGVDDSYGGWPTEGNIIAINPCYIAYGTIFLYYERKITNIISAGIGGGYSPTGGSFGGSITNATGHVVGMLVNLFPEGKALNGWFVGPEFNYHDFKYDETDSYYYYPSTDISTVHQYFVTYGMHGGYRWIFPSGFIVDLSAALVMRTGRSVIKYTDPDYNRTTYINYFNPTMGCNVGFAF